MFSCENFILFFQHFEFLGPLLGFVIGVGSNRLVFGVHFFRIHKIDMFVFLKFITVLLFGFFDLIYFKLQSFFDKLFQLGLLTVVRQPDPIFETRNTAEVGMHLFLVGFYQLRIIKHSIINAFKSIG